MSCISQAISSIDARCDVSMGGIKEILIGNFDDVNNVEIGSSNNPFRYITDIDMKIGTKMEKWQFRANTGSFTSTFSSDPAIGNNIVTTEVSLQFSRSESVKRKAIQDALGNANVVIIKDMYGNYIYLGKEEEVSVTSTTMQSGTSKGDLSGFNITFSYESNEIPHYISPDFDVDGLLVEKKKQVYQFTYSYGDVSASIYNIQGGHYYDTGTTETVEIVGQQQLCKVFSNTQIAGLKMYVLNSADLSNKVDVYGYDNGVKALKLTRQGTYQITKQDEPDLYDYNIDYGGGYEWDGTMVSKTIDKDGTYHLFASYMKNNYFIYVSVVDMDKYKDGYNVGLFSTSAAGGDDFTYDNDGVCSKIKLN